MLTGARSLAGAWAAALGPVRWSKDKELAGGGGATGLRMLMLAQG